MSALNNPIVLGYHGCRRSVGEAIFLDNSQHLVVSRNPWDWLGEGAYFWEADPRRGHEWAVGRYGEADACVVGAVIHLGHCLDLMARRSLSIVSLAYKSFRIFHERSFPDTPLPLNRDTPKGPSHALDCAVINHLHRIRADNRGSDGQAAPLPPFDTVRGLYQEGDGVFTGSKIMAKTHIQICVRNPEFSVQGYFRVPKAHLTTAD